MTLVNTFIELSTFSLYTFAHIGPILPCLWIERSWCPLLRLTRCWAPSVFFANITSFYEFGTEVQIHMQFTRNLNNIHNVQIALPHYFFNNNNWYFRTHFTHILFYSWSFRFVACSRAVVLERFVGPMSLSHSLSSPSLASFLTDF